MNKINWKLRFLNKATLSSLIGIIVLACFNIAQLFGLQLSVTQEQVLSVCEVILTILAGFGIIVDPTTQGVKDSADALLYDQPKASDPVKDQDAQE